MCAILARHGGDARVLAGGQSLGPLLNLRLAAPAVIVDVNRVAGLDGIAEEPDGLAVGALARQRAVERHPAVARRAPLLAEALPQAGHVAIRNRGTLGGSLAHADPAAELPACAVALGADVEAASVRGLRTIPAEELYVMPLVTTLAPEELLLRVRWPAPPPGTGTAWVEVARRHGDFCLAGAAAVLTRDEDGSYAAARVAVAGAGPTPVAARAAAAALAGRELGEEAFREAAARAAEECEPASDLHGSAGYRRRLVRAVVERALARAWERAR